MLNVSRLGTTSHSSSWLKGATQRSSHCCGERSAFQETKLGLDHPHVAATLNTLATLRKIQGHYADAEPLFRRALSIKKKASGPEHPAVAAIMNNLAEICHLLGRSRKPKRSDRQAIVILEKALGADHSDLATALNNLASVYRGPEALRRGRAAVPASVGD